jgi:hypothetical protein
MTATIDKISTYAYSKPVPLLKRRRQSWEMGEDKFNFCKKNVYT